MTPEEERNFKTSEAWERLYNSNVDRMCQECYAPDCEVIVMASGESAKGRDVLMAGERHVLAGLPDRTLTVTHRMARGDAVLVELTWQGTHTGEFMGKAPTGKKFSVAACAVQFFEDGLVVREHAYGEQMAWFQLGITPEWLARMNAEDA